MSDDGLTPEEIQRSNEVAAQYVAMDRARTRRETMKTLALIACVPSAASGWVMWATKPRIQREVEFIPITENGVPALAYRLEDLPPEARNDAAFTTVWNYVCLREEYSWGMAEKAYRIVSLMSDDRVMNEYQDLVNIKNKESPTAVYGRDAVISIDYDSHDDLSPPTGYSGPPPGYSIRFRRTVTWLNKPPERELWMCSVMFHRNVPKVDIRQRYEFSPQSIVVWQYPGARPITPLRRR
jgi:type IV secretory pathway component VirB8